MLDSIVSFARLVRFPNLILVWLALWWPAKQIFTLIGGLMGGIPPAFTSNHGLAALMMVTVCSTFSGYIINDIFDRKIDAINRPDRPSVAFFSEEQLWRIYYFGLTTVGLSVLFFFNEMRIKENIWAVFLFPAVNIALYLYAKELKCQALIGNFLVALLCGLVPFSLILLAYKGRVALGFVSTQWLILLSIFAFMANFMREIVKDIEDLKGDMEQGCQTFAGMVGADSARVFVYMIAAFEILAFVWFGIMMDDIQMFLQVVLQDAVQLLCIVVPLLAALFFLQQKNYARASLLLKIHILMGIVMVPLF